jgi:hypothetical protein
MCKHMGHICVIRNVQALAGQDASLNYERKDVREDILVLVRVQIFLSVYVDLMATSQLLAPSNSSDIGGETDRSCKHCSS